MRGRTVHRCSVVVVFISRTQTPPTLRRTTWRVCWWGPRSGYLVTRLIIEPKVVYGIQAALSERAASSDVLAAGPAFFCLRSKLRNVHLLLWGFVKGTMNTCSYLHCLGIQPEPCFPVVSNAKENSACAFHRREALMRMVIRPASAAKDASHPEARRFVVQ